MDGDKKKLDNKEFHQININVFAENIQVIDNPVESSIFQGASTSVMQMDKSEETLISNDSIEEFLHAALMHICTMRKSGRPREVVRTVDVLMLLLEPLIEKQTQTGFRTYLLEQKIRFLMEKSKSFMDFVLPEEVFYYMGAVNQQLLNTAKELRGKKLFYLPHISEESAYYVSRDYKRSYLIGKELIENICNIDSEWHIEILRSAAINVGYVGTKKELEDIKIMIDDYINVDEIGTLNDIAFLYEGIARAYGMHRDDKASMYIEKARDKVKMIKSTDAADLREVQLLRTEARVASKIGTREDVEKVIKKGLRLAKKNHYDRYIREFSELVGENWA